MDKANIQFLKQQASSNDLNFSMVNDWPLHPKDYENLESAVKLVEDLDNGN